MEIPVAVMETAGEGGAWGIAVLASYLVNKEENETWKTSWIPRYLQEIREAP